MNVWQDVCNSRYDNVLQRLQGLYKIPHRLLPERKLNSYHRIREFFASFDLLYVLRTRDSEWAFRWENNRMAHMLRDIFQEPEASTYSQESVCEAWS